MTGEQPKPKNNAMAYETEELLKEALEIAEQKSVMFLEDIIAELPCSSSTFYDHFKKDSEEMEKIKQKLSVNRTRTKRGLRAKWYNNDNATTQLALYKLIANDEERRNLSMQYIQGDVLIDDLTHLTNEERNDRIIQILADANKRGNIE